MVILKAINIKFNQNWKINPEIEGKIELKRTPLTWILKFTSLTASDHEDKTVKFQLPLRLRSSFLANRSTPRLQLAIKINSRRK